MKSTTISLKNANFIKNTKSINQRSQLSSFLMVLPQTIGFFLFTAYPLFWAIRFALYNYTGVVTDTYFIGLQNFVKIFTVDIKYWSALLNTFLFASLKTGMEIPFALVLAVLLNQGLKGSGFYRSMFYLPNIISIAIIGVIFSNMFGYFGVVNSIFIKYGIISSPIDWFSTKPKAMIVLLLASVWNSFGINVMYFLAALQNVPNELYECAKLDGAGRFTMFHKITVPMIAPVFKIILMLSIIGSLNTNDLILVITGGGPAGKTHTVLSFIVKNFVPGFADAKVNIGYGCATAVLTAIIFGIITVIYNKLSSKLSDIY